MFGGSQGNFQLDVCKPVMLLTSIELLTDASRSFVIAAPLRSSPIKAHQSASR